VASVAEIDRLLPQTQCTRCGYSGCRPYAEALAAGSAQLNQCPPGGEQTIRALAALLQRAPLPLNPAHGSQGPPLVAQIDEEACIGCAKCLPACPVDAIVGAHRQMHTVAAALCTGCELCIAPCPVDCIRMLARHDLADPVAAPAPLDNLARFRAHTDRAARRRGERAALLNERKQAARADAPSS
jgi:Na+-translocating ferredoxin:NAD+ oxidoreductase subunit B